MKSTIKARIMSLLMVPAFSLGFAAFAVSPMVANAAPSTDCPTITSGKNNNASLKNGAACAKGSDQQTDLFGQTGVFKTITNVLLFIIGAISVIMLIIGGVRYTVSGGDSSAVQSAKNTILYAIVGIVVAILAYAVVNFVISQFAAQ